MDQHKGGNIARVVLVGPRMDDTIASFRVQGRVLLALMLREARTRYGRRQIGYVWALLEPILHISMLAGFYVFLGRGVPLGDSLLMFLLTGMATFFGFRNVMSRTQGGYSSNQALLSFPVVHMMDVFVARSVLELANWIAVMLILFTAMIAAGQGGLPRDLLEMMEAILAMFLIAFGFGVTIGIAAEFMPSLAAFMRFPLRFLYFTSGCFYLPDDMFPAMRDVLSWNPIMHGIALFRMGYYPMYESHIYDGEYLWSWAIGSVLLAFIAEKLARKPIRNLVG